jgi:hypothetical protein
VESASASSKRLIQQIVPSWHHFRHHEVTKITPQSDNGSILTDDGIWAKDFFETYYPMDEPTDAEAEYRELHQGPLSTQNIIDRYRSDKMCFVIQNQVRRLPIITKLV